MKTKTEYAINVLFFSGKHCRITTKINFGPNKWEYLTQTVKNLMNNLEI